MSDKQAASTPKPRRKKGLAHLFAAAGYSVAGARRLWQETALRHMVLALVACLIEALNTAIECVVDHLALDWQEFARDAKDLGSLATMCLLCANGIFIAAVVARSFNLI